jgi:hypothetical protein
MKGIGIEAVPSIMETDHPHSENVFYKHRNRLYEASSVEKRVSIGHLV